MKKALLVLSGGRSVPNMLTIIHEKPDIIIVLASKDQLDELPLLDSTIKKLFLDEEHTPELKPAYVVDAFDIKDVYKKASNAVADYADHSWTFNITVATKIMSFGALQLATDLNKIGSHINSWYLDTLHASVIVLTGEGRDSNIFYLTIDQYATIHNSTFTSSTLEGEYDDRWLSFSDFMVQSLSRGEELKVILKHILPRPSKPSKGASNRIYKFKQASESTKEILEKAYSCGLLDDLQSSDQDISIKLSYLHYNFFDGPWLELYVWNQAQKLSIFSDCCWNLRIVDPQNPNDSKNQLDVTLIYNAQLIIIECKTGDEFFHIETLNQLNSLTSRLGEKFVTKILVTSLSMETKDSEKKKSMDKYKQKAYDMRIVLVTKEDLPNLAKILEKQAKDPDFPRH